ncbi:hypothetical protein J3R30DRAFT_3304421 [Lentinula aciculospora]|uniref:DUF1479-domain-containing protein n=1 Tax=Lentinula aciculospora TaxID=153920 RepID=A0A9W9DG04_9AGAR|nr:hypothetical protein J3R30DRAFT_3304421 [Lentinula aciculospora]
MATIGILHSRPSVDSLKSIRSTATDRSTIHRRLQKALPTRDKDVWANNEGTKPKALPAKYADLKKSLVKPEDYDAVQASWDRLLVSLEKRVKEIKSAGPVAVPVVDFNEIQETNCQFPEEIADTIRAAGCCVVRGVVPRAQALEWKASLLSYVDRHPDVPQLPNNSEPQIYCTFWQKAQIEARSHPAVIRTQLAMSQIYTASEDTEVDLMNQALYADRWRVRRPGSVGMFQPHLDNGSIERWEDKEYGRVFRKIWQGKWEEYDAWDMDHRAEAVMDLYGGPGACSAFRSLQGWLSIDDNGPQCGTIQLLPDIKLSMAYILLRPFFNDQNKLDMDSTYFYGADPGQGHVLKDTWHPHLHLNKSIVSCPEAAPGDYVLWHCDLVHKVEEQHKGFNDSSVIYIPVVPLCEYNIGNLVDQRKAFLKGVPPPDMPSATRSDKFERDHEDRGRPEDILTLEGRRLMGLEPFEASEVGITNGQKAIREIANEALEF